MSLFTFVILAASVAVARAEPPQVNTPASAQACLPLQITWSGGTPPYYLGLIAAGQPSSPLLKDFGPQTGTSYVWNVDSPAGTSYTVQIRDSVGLLNYSDQFTIQPSSQTCGTNSSTTATPASSSPATGAGAAGSTAGKNSTASATPSNNSSSAKPSTGASTTTSPTSASTSANTTLHSTSPTSANTTAASQARSSDAARLTSGFVGFAFSLALAVFA